MVFIKLSEHINKCPLIWGMLCLYICLQRTLFHNQMKIHLWVSSTASTQILDLQRYSIPSRVLWKNGLTAYGLTSFDINFVPYSQSGTLVWSRFINVTNPSCCLPPPDFQWGRLSNAFPFIHAHFYQCISEILLEM